MLKKIWDDINIQQSMSILNYRLADMTLSNQAILSWDHETKYLNRPRQSYQLHTNKG